MTAEGEGMRQTRENDRTRVELALPPQRSPELSPFTPALRELVEGLPRPLAVPPRGKVLRVKQGYNPNSSSIGSIIFPLPVLILGASVVLGTIAGILWTTFLCAPGEQSRQGSPDCRTPSNAGA